ncbi:ABC transporter ATP-binding protein [Streptomyces sp. 7-21]|uniref:dipeptide ABC transporter ATP-binding protein n=1 Tax=Streptomyces sp. 7-21 TaxID=2802283 RepID=UPI00191CFB81|nr:ABC transporter ATP-binding protein [Streptomyces sp. 7-21]MBL1068831.1 ABC transporter ATP-binding protein [Streptomyces sp. 7-21]
MNARRQPVAEGETLIEVRDLHVGFRTDAGHVRAVRGVDLDVRAGETVGVVGESGSGKTVTALSLLGEVRPPGRVEAGTVQYRGRDLFAMPEAERSALRGSVISMVFQDPMNSLDPVMKTGRQLEEAIRLHHRGWSRGKVRARALELLRLVGIPDPERRFHDYPFAFSGGMRQRIMIALAMSGDPEVLVADEPTTALDVTVQAQVLDVFARLNRELGTAIVLVTHNFGVVARLCDRVVVMYGGRVVERAAVPAVFTSARHPYTRGLIACVPRMGTPRDRRLPVIGAAPGEPAEPDGAEAGGAPPVGPPRAPRPAARGGPQRPAVLRGVGLRRHHRVRGGVLSRRSGLVRAVDGVDVEVRPGETLGIVGESGCGKSSLARLLVRADEPTAGRIEADGTDVTGLRGRRLAAFRRRVQMIFQDPLASLNPRLTVGALLAEPLLVHGLAPDRAARRARCEELLRAVGLPPEVLDRRPGQFSGGQLQRIAIARALAVGPQVLVCDEPVSSLDVSLQAQVINLLDELQAERGLSYVFISHDVSLVRYFTDRTGVMYLGTMVETGPTLPVIDTPLHPYTRSLIAAVPEPSAAAAGRRAQAAPPLAGELPSPLAPPPGCRFHPRCPIGPAYRDGRDRCATEAPALREIRPGHRSACHFAEELLADG